jgi:hypothetical protein
MSISTRSGDREPQARQPLLQIARDRAIVLDDQDPGRLGHPGIRGIAGAKVRQSSTMARWFRLIFSLHPCYLGDISDGEGRRLAGSSWAVFVVPAAKAVGGDR